MGLHWTVVLSVKIFLHSDKKGGVYVSPTSYKLRKENRKMPDEQVSELLHTAAYGVLSTADATGCPYGIPLNFVYHNEAIYFHCATEGHKLDNLRDNPQVSFCIVGNTETKPAEFTMAYESVILFGTTAEVLGSQKQAALLALIQKYAPEHQARGEEYILRASEQTTVVRISIDHITGKANM